MVFITDNGTSIQVFSRLRNFEEALCATGQRFIRRIVRNWTVYVSRKTIVVYNAYGTFTAGINREEHSRDYINQVLAELPISIKRLVSDYIQSYWDFQLERSYVRDASGMSDRTFGIELEFCFPSQWTRESLCAHMRDLGLDITCCGYTHEVRSNWKMVTDASVRADLPGYNTCEVSSPILKGREGLLEVNKLCQILDDCGCVVNKSCGFHVHHGARDLSQTQRLNVLDFYRKNEDIIDTIVSRSRRGNENTYCKSLKGTNASYFPSDRYMKVNACAYSKYGTLEFRQHQGTINYQKIANWIKLTQRIMEVSADKVRKYYSLEQMIQALDLGICLDFFNTRVRELAR